MTPAPANAYNGGEGRRKRVGLLLKWLQERSGGILAVMAIIGSVLGSAVYVVEEIREEIRAGDAQLREELRAVDVRLSEDIRHLDARMTAGDAQLREDIRHLDAKLTAGDAQLREEIRAGDAELRLALENLSNRILDILSGAGAKPVKETAQPVSGAGG